MDAGDGDAERRAEEVEVVRGGSRGEGGVAQGDGEGRTIAIGEEGRVVSEDCRSIRGGLDSALVESLGLVEVAALLRKEDGVVVEEFGRARKLRDAFFVDAVGRVRVRFFVLPGCDLNGPPVLELRGGFVSGGKEPGLGARFVWQGAYIPAELAERFLVVVEEIVEALLVGMGETEFVADQEHEVVEVEMVDSECVVALFEPLAEAAGGQVVGDPVDAGRESLVVERGDEGVHAFVVAAVTDEDDCPVVQLLQEYALQSRWQAAGVLPGALWTEHRVTVELEDGGSFSAGLNETDERVVANNEGPLARE